MPWFDRRVKRNFEILKPQMEGKPCCYLEIGCWKARSTIWVLDNILTHEDSYAVIVDPWEPLLKARRTHDKEEMDAMYRMALGKLTPYGPKVHVVRERSIDYLRSWKQPRPFFDFIYIDGDHADTVVIQDAVLSWPLCKIGGFMVFDDYHSFHPYEHHVRDAVDGFMRVYGNGYSRTVFKNTQYGIQKVADASGTLEDS